MAYTADLSQPIDISIPLQNGTQNPNCYYADPVEFSTIRSGDFVGSVAEGGTVNYQSVKLTPHGNGTHTECYGHISPGHVTLNECLKSFHFIAQLISVTPERRGGDQVVLLKDIEPQLADGVEALIIRTLPNESTKLKRQYSGTNPPYLEGEIGNFLKEKGVKHLLVDLPSVDREVDQGVLAVHRSFWDITGDIRRDATITELIYINNLISDGIYLLNLQITSLEMDASPSKPVLFNLKS
ncbi:N-formylkynurenine (Aryl-) formamidase [Fulvivirga imtechensis AK7]|uniref:N-formylkynurenine (Aryl-) formamidase n=2 Tax=Fulvivirga TaxID=396811 RepID=L8JLS3_9BACT|nr:N-formylkynurenine (Aryl-) formamidase [Fulvivirga imtechensis AK7]